MNKDLARYKKLLSQLSQFDIILPGTLRTVYQFCGKDSCACVSGKTKDAHGPYTYWDRNLNGKLASVSVKQKHIKFFKNGIKNRKDFDKIKKQIFLLADKIAKKLNAQ